MRRGERRSVSGLGEGGRALFEEGADALGVVGMGPGLTLQFAFEIELLRERVLARRVERALGQREGIAGLAGEAGGERLGLGQQTPRLPRDVVLPQACHAARSIAPVGSA